MRNQKTGCSFRQFDGVQQNDGAMIIGEDYWTVTLIEYCQTLSNRMEEVHPWKQTWEPDRISCGTSPQTLQAAKYIWEEKPFPKDICGYHLN